jgi:tetratricopeptide (TPR) repeat protein
MAQLQQANDVTTLKNILELIEEQQHTEALDLLQQHEFSAPYVLMQRQIEAELLVSMGERDRAERLYLLLIREYPEHIEPKFSLSQLYQTTGRANQALLIMNQVLETNPDFYMAWNNLGNIYRDLHNYTQAIECFKKALTLKEGYIPSICNLCLVYLDYQAPQLCIDLALKTLAIDPEIPLLYSHLAKAYLTLNLIDKAKETVQTGLSYEPRLNSLLLLEEDLFKKTKINS